MILTYYRLHSTSSRFEQIGKSTDYQDRILVGHRKAGLLVHRLFEGNTGFRRFHAGTIRNVLHDFIFMSQLQIFSSGRALQTTLRAAP